MLTYEEIQLLIEALDALGAKASSDRFVTSLICAMLAQDKEQRDAALAGMKLDEAAQREKQLLSERIVMIKSKLLQMRDAVEVQEIIK